MESPLKSPLVSLSAAQTDRERQRKKGRERERERKKEVEKTKSKIERNELADGKRGTDRGRANERRGTGKARQRRMERVAITKRGKKLCV